MPPAADAPLTRADLARLAGIVLLLVAFLMLTFTPQLVFEAWHRDGYARTEAELLAAPGRGRTTRVRILDGGDELWVRRSDFGGIAAHTHVGVWYNSAAIVTAGPTLLDTRVVSVERSPQLPELPESLGVALLNAFLFGVGAVLLLGLPRRGARRDWSRRARARR